MGVVAVLVFCVLLAGALIALLPIQRPPLSGLAFSVGFPAGELSGQLLALTVACAVALAAVGWPTSWLGSLAALLALATAGCFAVLWIRGLRAHRDVERALSRTRGLEVPAPALGQRRWLAGWRTLVALPVRGTQVRIRRDVAYLDDESRAHRLDVIYPREGAEGAPVMLFIHGGAWVVGSKREQGLPMLFELASRGWVCVTANYRLSPKATWPDHVIDVKRAIAWTKEHAGEFGGDPARFLAISGASAGGHLASLAALSPNDAIWQPGFEGADTSVDACVSLYGVLEMTGDPDLAGSQGRAIRRLLETSVFKAPLEIARADYERASPIHRITKESPPFLVLHGTKDTLVPVGVARAFVADFAATADAPLCYVELPGAQHAFDVLCSPRCTATTLGIAAFLESLVASRARDLAA